MVYDTLRFVGVLETLHAGDELVELPLRLAILLVCFLESGGASMDGGIRDWVVHS